MSGGLNLRCGNLDTLMLQTRQARQCSRRQTDFSSPQFRSAGVCSSPSPSRQRVGDENKRGKRTLHWQGASGAKEPVPLGFSFVKDPPAIGTL